MWRPGQRSCNSDKVELIDIPNGSKAPKKTDWPKKTVTTPEQAAQRFVRRCNIGLEHGQSQTGTFDIDNPEATAIAFAAIGLDLDELLAWPTVLIRGKNASKPLYDLRGLDLPYFRLTWPHRTERLANGRAKRFTVFELRAGPGKQDVLPPSRHPAGMHYTWQPHPPRCRADLLPPPPKLLEFWEDHQRLSDLCQVCPWAEQQTSPRPTGNDSRPKFLGESVTAAWNAKHSLHDVLTSFEYEYKGGNRYLPPESVTKSAGAYIYLKNGLEHVVVYNASSPICLHDELGKTRGTTAFGVYLEYEHGGDLTAAVRAAARELGMTYAEVGCSVKGTPWASTGSSLPNNSSTPLRTWEVESPWSKCL